MRLMHVCTTSHSMQVPEDTSLDAKGQTASVLQQIDALLARAGTDKTKILFCQVGALHALLR